MQLVKSHTHASDMIDSRREATRSRTVAFNSGPVQSCDSKSCTSDGD